MFHVLIVEAADSRDWKKHFR